jgi:Fe-S oxidoreductase
MPGEHRLPLVRPHEREHTYCAFCPKLCRFSCPVSTVQGRETTTPWGKMTSLHHVARGNLEMEATYAATWYACTGCMRCRTFCDHGNDVAATLSAGRAEAMQRGVALEAAYAVVDDHPGRERRARLAAEETFGARLREGSATVFVPGCTACAVATEDAKSALGAVDALADGEARVEAGGCCGLPLLEAGDADGFVEAARRFVGALAGAARVVFHDPGCLHALARIAPQLGVAHGLPMAHLSELAAEHLGRLGHVAVEGTVRYHDACRLGRGMGVYDAPRSVLAGILGRPAEELPQSRDRAECSGAGAQVPRTDRPTAEAIARERVADNELVGGGAIVTACPSSRRALAKQGARALDLNALIGRSLSG